MKLTDSEQVPPQQPFSRRPLLFMQERLALRRKGQDFSLMGMLCQGRRLEAPRAMQTAEEERLVEGVKDVGDNE